MNTKRSSFIRFFLFSGVIVTEGNLTINEDNCAADAILTFGNDAFACRAVGNLVKH